MLDWSPWHEACALTVMDGVIHHASDHREKNGYTVDTVDVYDIVDGKEIVVVHGVRRSIFVLLQHEDH